MRIITMKKLLLAGALLISYSGTSWALEHGSMKGSGLAMYDQGTLGGNTAATPKAATLDYKLVTIGSKTWTWNKVNGTTIDTGADWCSQLRYWSNLGVKTENNLTNRNATANLATEVWASSDKAMPSPVKISFFQNLVGGIGMCETGAFDYDPTAKNSAVVGDNTAPVISSATVASLGETTATLNLAGSDNEGDLFYHITGAGLEEIVFTSSFELSNLAPNTAYSLTIIPIDFSGNEGSAEVVNFTTTGLVQITSGIAKDIKFVLLSSNNELEYYYEFTDPSKTFREAFLKITPAGGSEFEIKPTISPDGKYAYGKTNDARLAGKVLSLNLGYFIYVAGDPIWEDYVMSNTVITSGALTGTSIKHKMGGGIDASEQEATAPTLASATLVDVTSEYIKLNISGADNSGTVFYQITGTGTTVNAFRTGDFYLTNIQAGQIYNLSVAAKDLSGNTSEAISLKAKTESQRSNIKNNLGMDYNNTTTTTSGGELVSIVNFDGTNLTLGCTTASNVIQNAGWLNREIYNPTVKINGVSYPLTLDANKTTATHTFAGQIGENEQTIQLTQGTALEIQWSVFWGEGGGNFFSGTFTYKIGDEGQSDTEGPSKPALSVSGTAVTWPACTDALSGVKYYKIEELTGSTPAVIIMDLGESSFSYTLSSASVDARITAVDFEGNETSALTSEITVGIDETQGHNLSVYLDSQNTSAIVEGVSVDKAIIYDLSGKIVTSAKNTNTIDVSRLVNGIYLVKIISIDGFEATAKLVIR